MLDYVQQIVPAPTLALCNQVLDYVQQIVPAPTLALCNQVLDYVQQKAEMYDLERSLSTWRRKVEIAEVEARRHHSLAAKQRAAQGAA